MAWSFWATNTPTPTNTEVPTATPTMTPTVEPTEVPPTATIGPTSTLDGPFTYVVQPDEVCYDIAIKFEVELEDLIYVNEWPEGQCKISVGQEIKVPPPWFTSPTPTPFPSDWAPGTLYEYHVQSGATLKSVAQYFNSTVERIVLETNRYRQREGMTNFITVDSALQIGELLIVPVNLVTPTPDSTRLENGQLIRIADGMEMVYVPEGEFTMGSKDADDDERLVRPVSLSAYWIDKYEVTNAQYEKCVNAGKCKEPSSSESRTRSFYYGNADYDDYPVIYVNWHQANAYCKWAGGSLPTEAQWEKAARGKNGRKYPWGDESPNSNLVNYGKIKGDTTAVGSYPRGVSPYGAMDMAGNVWEWVMDRYGPYDAAETNNPQGPGTGDNRVLRGGSWYYSLRSIRSADRDFNDPTNTYNSIGFRCVSSP